MALISLAVSTPISVFLASCFEIANDSEAPESWLCYGGVVRLLCGLRAHRRWRYCGPAGQPLHFVRWYARCADAPKLETLANLVRRLVSWLTCRPPPWVIEAREDREGRDATPAASATATEATPSTDQALSELMYGTDVPRSAGATMDVLHFSDSHGVVMSHSWVDDRAFAPSIASSGRGLRAWKHSLTAVGLGGVLILWAVYAWCGSGLHTGTLSQLR